MTALIRPIPHSSADPACYGCAITSAHNCGDVCSACGCGWELDTVQEPNRTAEWCEDGECLCHEWALVESRAMARNEESLEAAWRDAGFGSSIEVWQAESR